MEIIKIDPKNPNLKLLHSITLRLKNGEIGVAPTDTCYGFVADATRQDVVGRLFKVKQRNLNKPISIMVSDREMMAKYAVLNQMAMNLINKYLPGALTLVMERTEKDLFGVLDDSVGVRIPDCKISLNMVTMMGRPLTTSSANISGQANAYDLSEILAQFENEVLQPDFVLDGGILEDGGVSTIVDVRENGLKILREGNIKL